MTFEEATTEAERRADDAALSLSDSPQQRQVNATLANAYATLALAIAAKEANDV